MTNMKLKIKKIVYKRTLTMDDICYNYVMFYKFKRNSRLSIKFLFEFFL